ncbi:hypothetical protein FRC00_006876 [Tulasnella sp. 408]|nr:hypothetical protein FRC00_006876 [Tulasnella sp. 408]
MSSSSATSQEDSNDRIVIRCGPVRKLIIRPETYQDALKLVSETFILPEKTSQIAFSAKLSGLVAMTSDSNHEEFTAISEHNWADCQNRIKILRVVKRPKVEKADQSLPVPATGVVDGKRTIKVVHESYGRKYEISATSPLQDVFRAFATSVSIPVEELKFYDQGKVIEPSDTPSSLSWRQVTTLKALRYYIQFTIYTSAGAQVSIRMKHNSPMSKVYDVVTSRIYPCIKDFRLLDGRSCRINPDETASDVYSRSGADIDVIIEQTGGKPVIYLFPPQQLEATVRLSLEPSWKFDAVYPIKVVGTDPGKQQDRTMFRVLKWGGMEVYSERRLPDLPEREINLE